MEPLQDFSERLVEADLPVGSVPEPQFDVEFDNGSRRFLLPCFCVKTQGVLSQLVVFIPSDCAAKRASPKSRKWAPMVVDLSTDDPALLEHLERNRVLAVQAMLYDMCDGRWETRPVPKPLPQHHSE